MSQSNASLDDSIIKIKAARVAQLMDMVGELSLATDEVLHHPELRDLELNDFQSSAYKLHQMIRELQDIASGMRLVPITAVFKKMQRLGRDLAKKTKKSFDFIVQGEETEIDKLVVAALSDPLVHMIRNSVDHGLETDEERAQTGKTEKAKVWLTAKQVSGEIIISIKDNGRGLDREKILSRAIERGIISDKQSLTDAEVWDLIFEPGFSTAEMVSDLSGRGVGMDVVRTTITDLRGRTEIESVKGEGSVFNLIIPLSLAFLETMVVEVEGDLFAIPIDSIEEVFQIAPEAINYNSSDHYFSVKLRNELIPAVSLKEIYEDEELTRETLKTLVVVSTFRGKIGIPVNKILGQYQVTLKTMSGLLASIRAVTSCAILPSGDVCWLLDCNHLSQTAGIN